MVVAERIGTRAVTPSTQESWSVPLIRSIQLNFAGRKNPLASTSDDLGQVLTASEQLARSTRVVLRRLQRAIPSHTTIGGQFRHAYPEIRDMVSKLVTACQQGDYHAASTEPWLLQAEVTLMLNRTAEGIGHRDFNLYGELDCVCRELRFPDLMRITSGDLEELAQQVRPFDEKSRCFLEGHSGGPV